MLVTAQDATSLTGIVDCIKLDFDVKIDPNRKGKDSIRDRSPGPLILIWASHRRLMIAHHFLNQEYRPLRKLSSMTRLCLDQKHSLSVNVTKLGWAASTKHHLQERKEIFSGARTHFSEMIRTWRHQPRFRIDINYKLVILN